MSALLATASARIPHHDVDWGTALLGAMVLGAAVNVAVVALVALLIAAVRRRVRAWQLLGVAQSIAVWVAAAVISGR